MALGSSLLSLWLCPLLCRLLGWLRVSVCFFDLAAVALSSDSRLSILTAA